jgi:hypothetical protein
VNDGLLAREELRERMQAEMVGQHALSLVVRCEACGLGYELLGIGGGFEAAGSCGDCGGPLYVLDGFVVDGSHVADAYGEGFASGWDACLGLWADSVEGEAGAARPVSLHTAEAAAEAVDSREAS